MMDDFQEQTMHLDDFEEDFDETRQLAGKYNVSRGSISYNQKSTDGTETGRGLWSNKNYQFETKDPSFYQDVLSTPQVERQVENKINSAINNSERCAVCSKIAYAQEQVKAVRKVFHKACFRCCNCNSTLQTSRVAEHGNDLYCQNCYEKTFGNRKYGSVEKSISPESTSERYNNNNSGYDNIIVKEEPPALGLKPVSWNTQPRKSMSDIHDQQQPRSRRVSSHQKPPPLSGNAEDTFKSVKDLLKPVKNKERCVSCTKPVYANELVKWNEKAFHKLCFKCTTCKKTLQLSDVVEFNKIVYCEHCHLKMRTRYPSEQVLPDHVCENLSDDRFDRVEILIQPEIPLNTVTVEPPTVVMFTPKSPAKKIEIKSEVCNVCKKTVYQVEEVKHMKLVIHKSCFKCCQCHKLLEMGHIATRGENLFCHTCFKKDFASKGYDFGLGSLQLEMRESCGSFHSIDEIAPRVEQPEEDYRSVVLKSVSTVRDERAKRSSDRSPAWNSSAITTKPRDFTKSRSAQPQYGYQQPLPSQQQPATQNSRFGNSSVKCSKCKKPVYAVEQVKAFDKSFHKTCLRCNVCKKQLESNTVQEHDNEAYCKNCHMKYFGPTGYGIGRASVTNERQNVAPVHALWSPGQQQQAQQHQPEVVRSQQSSRRSSYTFDGDNYVIRDHHVRRGQAKRFGGGADKCMRCNQTVYEMEKVVALKMPFHKSCYSCFGCKKTLSPKSCCESPEGEIYCNSCNPGSSGLGRAL